MVQTRRAQNVSVRRLWFAEVLPDRVRVLADTAERAEEIDMGRAEEAATRARERMSASVADTDFERAQLALLKSTLRLDVARKAGTTNT